MQALILSSRAITQDQFFRRQQYQKYQKHKLKLQTIQKEKHNTIDDWKSEVQTMAHTLRKAKSNAKIFHQKQLQEVHKKQNISLFKRIWQLQPTIGINSNQKYQLICGSSWNQYKKNQLKIKQENKKIGEKVLLQKIQVKDYKKKLKEEIKEYLKLRDGIRKLKYTSSLSKKNLQQTSPVKRVKLQKLQKHLKQSTKHKAQVIQKDGIMDLQISQIRHQNPQSQK